ncbi:MAG TPA: outer membrane beta-barrel protein [Verrucomicrobiae bacterium]|nr:outer membrane beta-barrel protein [Verrucomicrobiae bacterium]
MNRLHPSTLRRRRKFVSRALKFSIGGVMAISALGQDATRFEKLEAENRTLKERLDKLESMAKKEGIVPSGSEPASMKALKTINVSGFVQASYFYNTDNPNDKMSDAYLWNTRHNSFSINKVKLTLASDPIKKDVWDAGYRVSMIWGEDAGILNTGGEVQGLEALREAYVNLNVPVGTGLDIKVGQLISLLNYESGDGGAANNNFSQGYQWFYTGNGPSAGIQAGYAFNDVVDAKVRVQNGMYAGAIDNNNSKTVMGSIGIKPVKDLWVNLIGFGGEENAGMTVKGGSVLAGYSGIKNLSLGMEFDYFMFDFGATDADLWSIGTFVNYDITDKLGIAARLEYLDDKDGGGLKGIGPRTGAAFGVGSPEADGYLASATLTLTYKPIANIRIQPEVRYDTTDYTGALDGEKSRFIVGAGVSYLF